MRLSTNIRWLLAVLLFAMVFLPSKGWAATTIKNCPKEPATGVSIASGITYSGSNCNLYTTGDIDSFVFTASPGDVWSLILGFNGSTASNICMSLYAPNNSTAIYTGCTSYPCCGSAVSTNINLTVGGMYTIDLKELTNGTMPYDLTLERISPAPADAQPTVLANSLTGLVSAPTAQEAYLFAGVTTGTYQVALSLLSNPGYNVCESVYQPDGTLVGTACTSYPCCGTTTSIDVTPTLNANYLVVVYAAGNDVAVGYTLDVSCLVGKCKQITLTCALTDALSYNPTSGILTMDFTLATPVAATWNAWLTTGNSIKSLWSVSQPVTEPSTTIAQTQSVAKSGKVGVLSTLTVPKTGITCSNFATYNTGQ